MRQITVKYAGECAKCGAELPVGASAAYERITGIFCIGCFPMDSEEIREFRTARAERKAERLDAWAEKREERAAAALNSHPNIRHDWAFITQPGRIPFRERMNRADARAVESLRKAESMRARAEGLRKVRVKGDAAKRDEAKREGIRPLLSKGSRVFDWCFGNGTVIKVNRLSASVKFDRCERAFARDLIFLQAGEKYQGETNKPEPEAPPAAAEALSISYGGTVIARVPGPEADPSSYVMEADDPMAQRFVTGLEPEAEKGE